MKALLRSNFTAALVGAALMLYAQVSAAPFAPNFSDVTASHVPDEVLVKFKPAAIGQDRVATVAALGTHRLAQPGTARWMHVKLGAGQSVTEALVGYQSDPNVEYASPTTFTMGLPCPTIRNISTLGVKNTGQTVTTGTYSPQRGTAGDDMNIEAAWVTSPIAAAWWWR